MLHGVARPRIYGMGVLLAVAVVVVAVVAAGGQCPFVQLQDGLQLLVGRERVIYRLIDADAPGALLRVDTLDYHLAANVNHQVIDAMRLQHAGHLVHGEPLGYGATVQHDAWVVFHHLILGIEAYLPVAHQLPQAIHLHRVGEVAFLKPEAPGIDQRGYGNVEGSIRLLRDFEAAQENRPEEGVGLH